MNVLVTGASGFLGQALMNLLLEQNYSIRPAVRTDDIRLKSFKDKVVMGDLSSTFDWSSALIGVDVVIHTAARVHVMNDHVSNPLSEFRKVNTDATLNLAKQAAMAGVKRFIFISSIKVNGEQTFPEHYFSVDDEFIPTDPYGLSKFEAEKGLLKVAKETGMDVVIIRPPLIYGPNVKANFASMVNWVKKGIPLPLGAINNKRSFIALENLVSFISCCIKHPKAANEVFLVSDGDDVSTTELLRKVAAAFEVKSRLIPIPVSWMTFVAKLLGKQGIASRLFGSLQVDSSKARNLVGWKPVITMDEQLKKTAEAYLKNEKTL